MDRVGIRELKQNASAVVAAVVAGDDVLITDRGRPVARMVPIRTSRLEEMIRDGRVRIPTTSLADLPRPTGPVDMTNRVSEDLLRSRNEQRY